jgi:ferredoxin-NADP reductase
MLRNKNSGILEPKTINKVGMIAAGSGLTPMFQLIQSVADDSRD